MPTVESDIERAWRLHDPYRGRVPADVRRQLRQLKEDLDRDADATEKLLVSNRNVASRRVTDCIRRRGVARQRALREVRDRCPGAVVVGQRDSLELRWLSPHRHVLAEPRRPGERQDCIVGHVALLWSDLDGIGETLWRRWLIEAPDHATHRFLQRAPGSSLKAALFEAMTSFAGADAVTRAAAKGADVFLKAGLGAFVCDPIHGTIEGSDVKVVYARARTWLPGNDAGAVAAAAAGGGERRGQRRGDAPRPRLESRSPGAVTLQPAANRQFSGAVRLATSPILPPTCVLYRDEASGDVSEVGTNSGSGCSTLVDVT